MTNKLTEQGTTLNLIELLNEYTNHQQRMAHAEAELLSVLYPRFEKYESTLSDLRDGYFYPIQLGEIEPRKGTGTWYRQSDDWRIECIVTSEQYLEVGSTISMCHEPDDEYIARIPLWLLHADWDSVLAKKSEEIAELFKDRTRADADA